MILLNKSKKIFNTIENISEIVIQEKPLKSKKKADKKEEKKLKKNVKKVKSKKKLRTLWVRRKKKLN